MANYSHQRELIRKNMMSRRDHPTADAVYHSIREELPTISLGTVYRNLKLLAEQGEIIILDIGDGREHFDADTNPHDHFVCDRCGQVQDLRIDPVKIDEFAQGLIRGKISSHRIYFYGLCADCMDRSGPV